MGQGSNHCQAAIRDSTLSQNDDWAVCVYNPARARPQSEIEVADSCAGTSIKLGTTSDKIEGRDPLFACQDIGQVMTYPLSVENGNVYVCCVSYSESEVKVADS